MPNKTVLNVLLFGSVFAVASTPAFADVTSGTAEAYGVSSNIAPIATMLSASGNPFNSASNSAPAPFNTTTPLTNISLGSSSTPGLASTMGASLVQTSISSNVDGTSGTKKATANVTIQDLTLKVFDNDGNGNSTPLFEIYAHQISPSSLVYGDDYGNLGAQPSVYIDQFSFHSAMTGYVYTTGNYPSRDTVLYNSDGIKITLNSQPFVGCYVNFCQAAVNGVVISINNASFAAAGVKGDLILGHTYATINAVPGPVPEASTYSMMLVGLGLVGLISRRRFSPR